MKTIAISEIKGARTMFAERLTHADIREKLRKAINKFKEIALRPPDKIIMTITKLPKIIIDSKEIDLQKKYGKGSVYCTMIGIVPYIPYLAKKGDTTVLRHIHFFESPVYLAVDPDDNTRIFLCYEGNIKVTERGIEG